MYFYDTCALLNLQEEVFDEQFVICSQTLIEIENIKESRSKSDDVKYRARKMSKLLAKRPDDYIVAMVEDPCWRVRDELRERGMAETPDNLICCTAYLCRDVLGIPEMTFVTDDLNCLNIAKKIFGLKAEKSKKYTAEIYKGYKTLMGNTAEINEAFYDPNFLSSFVCNEYLLIYNTDDDNETEMRFDGEKFVALKLPPSRYIKGKNALQRCALDMLNNKDITVCGILGGVGSGKSYLSARMALYGIKEKGTHSKILVVRTPQAEGVDIGYLPGDAQSKTDPFWASIIHQLDGGEFEFRSMMQQGILETNIPRFMKGTSYSETFFLTDEAEDLTKKELKLIGTRLGEGSKIVFNGDYKQSMINTTEENALVQMCDSLKGNKLFACIYLDEDVRSETSKMFAELFKD